MGKEPDAGLPNDRSRWAQLGSEDAEILPSDNVDVAARIVTGNFVDGAIQNAGRLLP